MIVNISLLKRKGVNYISTLEVIFDSSSKYHIEIMTSWIEYKSIDVYSLKKMKTRQLIHSMCSGLASEIERKIMEKTS